MKPLVKYIHPVLGVRSLRLDARQAASYGYTPYEEPVLVQVDAIQPQTPEQPKPEPATPIPVAKERKPRTPRADKEVKIRKPRKPKQ